MDLCLLLLLLVLLLLHSLCQCDLPHWLLFRLRGLLRPLGLALWVKKAIILSPLLRSTTQQAAQCPGTANPPPEQPPATSSSPGPQRTCPLKQTGLSLAAYNKSTVSEYSLLHFDFTRMTMLNNVISDTKQQGVFTCLSRSFFFPALYVNYGGVTRDIYVVGGGATNCKGWKNQA